MEPSSLIFVALAVAWAVYLGPKLFAHHDEGLRSRTVSTFSKSIRVLARREASAKGTTNLVRQASRESRRGAQPRPAAGRASDEVGYVEVAPRLTPNQLRARRTAAKRATRRRRNVLVLLLLAILGVATVAYLGIVGRIWVAAPVVLLLAWLVTCRVTVRRERSVATVRVPAVAEGEPLPAYEIDEDTGEIRAVYDEPPAESDESADASELVEAGAVAGRWDPVEPPLPTYVSKPAAPRRTVRTIDLDSTGVWSSGRNASDSALARKAEAAARTAKEDTEQARRASGS